MSAAVSEEKLDNLKLAENPALLKVLSKEGRSILRYHVLYGSCALRGQHDFAQSLCVSVYLWAFSLTLPFTLVSLGIFIRSW